MLKLFIVGNWAVVGDKTRAHSDLILIGVLELGTGHYFRLDHRVVQKVVLELLNYLAKVLFLLGFYFRSLIDDSFVVL